MTPVTFRPKCHPKDRNPSYETQIRAFSTKFLPLGPNSSTMTFSTIPMVKRLPTTLYRPKLRSSFPLGLLPLSPPHLLKHCLRGIGYRWASYLLETFWVCAPCVHIARLFPWDIWKPISWKQNRERERETDRQTDAEYRQTEAYWQCE